MQGGVSGQSLYTLSGRENCSCNEMLEESLTTISHLTLLYKIVLTNLGDGVWSTSVSPALATIAHFRLSLVALNITLLCVH